MKKSSRVRLLLFALVVFVMQLFAFNGKVKAEYVSYGKTYNEVFYVVNGEHYRMKLFKSDFDQCGSADPDYKNWKSVYIFPSQHTYVHGLMNCIRDVDGNREIQKEAFIDDHTAVVGWYSNPELTGSPIKSAPYGQDTTVYGKTAPAITIWVDGKKVSMVKNKTYDFEYINSYNRYDNEITSENSKMTIDGKYITAMAYWTKTKAHVDANDRIDLYRNVHFYNSQYFPAIHEIFNIRGQNPQLYKSQNSDRIDYYQVLPTYYEVLDLIDEEGNSYNFKKITATEDVDGKHFTVITSDEICVKHGLSGPLNEHEKDHRFLGYTLLDTDLEDYVYYSDGYVRQINSCNTHDFNLKAHFDGINPGEQVNIVELKGYGGTREKVLRGSKYTIPTPQEKAPTTFTVTFDYQDGVTPSLIKTGKVTYTPVGYSLDGVVYPAGTKITVVKNIVLEPVYKETISDVDFPTDPSRQYYTFKGWFDQGVGGRAVSKIEAVSQKLYAQWVEKDKVTVIRPDGVSINLQKGTEYTLPFIPKKKPAILATVLAYHNNETDDYDLYYVKTNYIIGGYNINNKHYDVGDTIVVNENIDLRQHLIYNEERENPTFKELTRDDYTFLGYYDSVTGGTKYTEYTGTTNKILYAHWSNDNNNVKITYPDGTFDKVLKGSNYTLRDGIAKSDESKTVTFKYQDDSTADYITSVNKQFTSNGWYIDGIHYDEGQTITADKDMTVESDYIETIIPATFPSNPVRVGYNFKGWYNQASGGTKYTSYSIFDDITLYAQWTTLSYQEMTVTVLPAGTVTKVRKGYSYTLPTLPSKDDDELATVTLKYQDGSTKDKIKKVTKSYTVDKWDISGDTYTTTTAGTSIRVNNNLVISPIYKETINPVTFKDAEREGYLFRGWYDIEGNRYTYYDGIDDITLYAHWEETEFPIGVEFELPELDTIDDEVLSTVTFKYKNDHRDTTSNVVRQYIKNGWIVDGKLYQPGDKVTLKYDSIIKEDYTETIVPAEFPEDPIKEGSTFKGWFDKETNGGNKYTTYDGEEDITLYARWKRNGTAEPYTLGINNTPKESIVISTKTFVLHNGEEDITVNIMEDFVPNGWLVDGEPYPDGATIMKYPDTVIRPNYTIFVRNADFPADPVKPGYKFIGWFTSETGGYQVTILNTYDSNTLHAQYTDSFAYLIDGPSFNSKIYSKYANDYSSSYSFRRATSEELQEVINTLDSSNVISTNDSPVPVYFWRTGSTILVGSTADTIYFNPDSSFMFSTKENERNTSAAREYYSSIDLSKFNSSIVTNMKGMFAYQNNATTINLRNFNTSRVTDMSWLFYATSSLSTVDVTSFDTHNVTTMKNMFGAGRFTSLNVTRFDTSNVTDMSYMFENNLLTDPLNLSRFDTSKVTNMSYMLSSIGYVPSIDVSSFDTSNVTDMSNMFSSTPWVTTLNLGSFDTSSVENANNMFYNTGSNKLTTIYVSEKWNLSDLPSNQRIFFNNNQLVGQKGTVYDGHDYKDYAIIDDAPNNPGYLTHVKNIKPIPEGTHTVSLPDYTEEVDHGSTYDIPNNRYPKENEDVAKVTFKYGNGHEDTTSKVQKQFIGNGFTIDGVHYDDGGSIVVVKDIALIPDYTEVNLGAEFPEDPSNNQFEFIGWFDHEFGGTQYTNYAGNEDITLYAQWKVNVAPIPGQDYVLPTNNYLKEDEILGTVTFKYHNGTADTTSTVIKQYINHGWLVNGDYYNDGDVINVVEGVDYIIEPNYIVKTIQAEYPENPSKDGYEFAGWYTEETGGKLVSAYSGETDITLHAQYSDDYALLDLGGNVNTKLKSLCNSYTGLNDLSFRKATQDEYNLVSSSLTDDNKISSSDSPKTVYAWLSGDEVIYYSDADIIYAKPNSIWMFKETTFKTIDISGINTTKVTDLGYFFEECHSLEEIIGLDTLYTHNVKGMAYMFHNTTSLKTVDLSHFDTSKVTGFHSMFSGSAVTKLDLRSFDISSATRIDRMFQSTRSLKELDITSFDTSNITNMEGTFAYTALDEIDLSHFDTSKVNNVRAMFSNVEATTIYVSEKWGLSNSIDDYRLFWRAYNLVGQKGTVYDEGQIDRAYAIIDDAPEHPGYLTYRKAPGSPDTYSVVYPDGRVFNVVAGGTHTLLENNYPKEDSKLATVTFKYYNGHEDTQSYVMRNYTPNGWLVEGTHYGNGQNITVNSDILLEPDYTNATIKAEFPENPTAENLKFKGWYSAASGGSKYSSYYNLYDITLHAQWDSTTNPMPGSPYTLPTNNTTKASENVASVLFKYQNGKEDTVSYVKKNFKPNGWLVDGVHKNTGEIINVTEDTVIEPDYTITYSSASFPANPTRTGYTFMGWFDAEFGGNIYSRTTGYKEPRNITLYAHWSKTGNTYTLPLNEETKESEVVSLVTFKYHNGEADTYGQVIRKYVPNGWLVNGVHKETGENITKTDQTIIEPDFREVIVPVELPKNPTKTDYLFEGWYDAETGGNKIVVYKGTENITLHAHYTNNYAILTTGPLFHNKVVELTSSYTSSAQFTFRKATESEYNEVAETLTNANIISARTSPNVAYMWTSGNLILYYSPVDIIFMNEDSSSMFFVANSNTQFNKFLSIDMTGLNSSRVRSMHALFKAESNSGITTSIDLTNFDTHNVTDMYGMFSGLNKITSIDTSSFDTRKVKDMSGMFDNCSKITSLDLSHFDTSNVTNMTNMFGSCYSLTYLNVSNFDTSKVKKFDYMFAGCRALTEIDVRSFNTEGVTSEYESGYASMFGNMSSITELDLTSFSGGVGNMVSMFSGCSNLVTIYVSEKWEEPRSEYFEGRTFESDTKLVGQKGTTYDANHVDSEYARVDEGPSRPGYLTFKGLIGTHKVTLPNRVEEVKHGGSFVIPKNTISKASEDLATVTFKYGNGQDDTTSKVQKQYVPNGWSIEGLPYSDNEVIIVLEDITIDAEYSEIQVGATYPSTPYKEGYAFVGWYTEETGGERVDSYNELNDITLYAHWTLDPPEPNQPYVLPLNDNAKASEDLAEVTFKFNNGDVDYIGYVTKVYTPNGWLVDGTHYNSGDTINIGDTIPEIIPDYTEVIKGVTFPTDPKRVGLYFDGWYDAKVGGTKYTSYEETNDITLYARYTDQGDYGKYKLPINNETKPSKIISTVTFKYHNGQEDTTANVVRRYEPNGWLVDGVYHGNGEYIKKNDNTVIVPSFAEFIDQVIFPATPTKNGSSFVGWYTAETGGDHVTTYKGTIDITLHAQYTESYSILVPGTTFRNIVANKTLGQFTEATRNNNIYFRKANQSEYNAVSANLTSDNIISTSDSPYVTYIWFNESNDEVLYYSEADVIYANPDSSYMFSPINKWDHNNFSYNIIDLSGINFNKATTFYYMFYTYYSRDYLKEIIFGDIDTSNVTNMSGMFLHNTGIRNLDVSKFNTGNVTNMSTMFGSLTSIEELDVSNFDTHNVINMNGLFSVMEKLSELDLSNFDTRKVTNMGSMFSQCKSLDYLDVSMLNTHNVTDMSYMFSGMLALRKLDLGSFDTSNVTTMYSMFQSDMVLRYVNLSSFDTSKVTNMQQMFDGTGLMEIDVTSFNTSNVTNMQHMFNNSDFLKRIVGLSSFDTSNVTSMQGMLAWNSSLEYVDISNFTFDSISGNGVYGLFERDENLKEVVFGDIKFNNPSSMAFMFDDDRSLVRISYNSIDTSNVNNMEYLFAYCESLNDFSMVTEFDTSNVTRMNDMFLGVSVTTLDLSNFDTRNVTSMNGMFAGSWASAPNRNLRTIYVSDFWDTSKVTNGSSMFQYSSSLVGEKGTTFDSNHIDVDYAHVDGGTSNPGYLTYKKSGYNVTLPDRVDHVKAGDEYTIPLNDYFKDDETLSTVTFKYQNGQDDTTSNVVKKYVPKEWKIEDEDYENREVIKVYKDIVLLPQYEEELFEAEFPADPTKDNYIFDGWHTSATGGTRYFNYAGDSNLTLYAHWAKPDDKFFDLTYCDLDGECETTRVTNGTKVKLAKQSASKELLLYLDYQDENPRRQYKATYKKESSSFLVNDKSYNVDDVVTITEDTTIVPEVKIIESKSTIAEPTKEGQKFIGWYTDASAGSQIDIDSITYDQFDTYNGNTLYAHYVEVGTNQVVVDFDGDIRVVNKGTTENLPSTKNKDSDSFIIHWIDSHGSNYNSTITNSYSLDKFLVNGEEKEKGASVTYNEDTVIRSQYTTTRSYDSNTTSTYSISYPNLLPNNNEDFLGWFVLDDEIDDVSDINTETNIYAHYVEKINLDVDGKVSKVNKGTVYTVPTSTVNESITITLDQNYVGAPSPVDYTITTSNELEYQTINGVVYFPGDEITLNEDTVVVSTASEEETTIEPAYTKPERTGYIFKGWLHNNEEVFIENITGRTTSLDNETLTGDWEEFNSETNAILHVTGKFTYDIQVTKGSELEIIDFAKDTNASIKLVDNDNNKEYNVTLTTNYMPTSGTFNGTPVSSDSSIVVNEESTLELEYLDVNTRVYDIEYPEYLEEEPPVEITNNTYVGIYEEDSTDSNRIDYLSLSAESDIDGNTYYIKYLNPDQGYVLVTLDGNAYVVPKGPGKLPGPTTKTSDEYTITFDYNRSSGRKEERKIIKSYQYDKFYVTVPEESSNTSGNYQSEANFNYDTNTVIDSLFTYTITYPEIPEVNSENFLGWYTKPNGGELVTSLEGKVEDYTLYARYDNQIMNITLDETVYTVPYGDEFEFPAGPSKTSESITLHLHDNYGEDNVNDYVISKDYTFKSYIIDGVEYNAGDKLIITEDKLGHSTYTESKSTNDESLLRPERDNYLFAGWEDSEHNRVNVSSLTADDTEYDEKDLYAKWEEDNGDNITIDYDGEIIVVPSGTYTPSRLTSEYESPLKPKDEIMTVTVDWNGAEGHDSPTKQVVIKKNWILSKLIINEDELIDYDNTEYVFNFDTKVQGVFDKTYEGDITTEGGDNSEGIYTEPVGGTKIESNDQVTDGAYYYVHYRNSYSIYINNEFYESVNAGRYTLPVNTVPKNMDNIATITYDYQDGRDNTYGYVRRKYTPNGWKIGSTFYINNAIINVNSDRYLVSQYTDSINGVTELPNPTRKGYRFDGWYTNTEYTEKVTSYSETSDITLYAKWVKQITITPEDGEVEIVDQGTKRTLGAGQDKPEEYYNITFKYNYEGAPADKVVRISTYEKFVGWLVNGTFYNVGDEVTFMEDTSVVGKYEKVINNKNLPADPTRSGYAFTGWYDAMLDGELVDITKIDYTQTVYAYWDEFDPETEVRVTWDGEVTIYPKGTTLNLDREEGKNKTERLAVITFIMNNDKYDNMTLYIDKNYSRDHYLINDEEHSSTGEYTVNEDTVINSVYTESINYPKLPIISDNTFKGFFTSLYSGEEVTTLNGIETDSTFYAHWEEEKVQIIIDGEEDEVPKGTKITLENGKAKETESIDITLDYGNSVTKEVTITTSYTFDHYDVNGVVMHPGDKYIVNERTVVTSIYNDETTNNFVGFDNNNWDLGYAKSANEILVNWLDSNDEVFDLNTLTGADDNYDNSTYTASYSSDVLDEVEVTVDSMDAYYQETGKHMLIPQDRELDLDEPEDTTFTITFNNKGTETTVTGTKGHTFSHFTVDGVGNYQRTDNYTFYKDVVIRSQYTDTYSYSGDMPIVSDQDFIGWYTSETNGSQVTDINDIKETTTLYAHYRNPGEHTVYFDDRAYTYDDTVTSVNPINEGYAANEITKKYTLTLDYQKENYDNQAFDYEMNSVHIGWTDENDNAYNETIDLTNIEDGTRFNSIYVDDVFNPVVLSTYNPNDEDFLGWYTDSTNGEKVTTYNGFEDVTYYAHYATEQQAIVTIDGEVELYDIGSTLTLPEGKNKNGESITVTFDPTNGENTFTKNITTTYTFNGYKYEKDQNIYDPEDTFTVNENMEFNSEYTKGTTTDPWPEDPTKQDYIFIGWYTSKTSGIQRFNYDSITSNTNLYAQWTTDDESFITLINTINQKRERILKNSDYIFNNSTFNEETKEKMGTITYKFESTGYPDEQKDYYKRNNPIGFYVNNDTSTLYSPTEVYNFSEDTYITPVYDENNEVKDSHVGLDQFDYTVTNGVKLAKCFSKTIQTDPKDEEAYTCYTEYDENDGDVTVYLHWKDRDEINVTDPEGNVDVYLEGDEYPLGTNTNTKEGNNYTVTFKYQDDVTEDTTQSHTETYTPNGWLVNGVHYDNEAVLVLEEDIVIEYDYTEEITNITLPTPTKEGSAFHGWNSKSNGTGTTYTNESINELNGDTTVYGIWTPEDITITFNTHGGEAVSSITVPYNTPIGDVLPTTTKENERRTIGDDNVIIGYILDGWYKEDTYENKVSSQSKFTENITLHANWIEDEFPYVYPYHEDNFVCTGSNYIDTGVMLYTDQNNDYLKDYEVGFTIRQYNPSEQEKQAVFFNAKWENEANGYPGLVFRRYTTTNNLEITQRINRVNASKQLNNWTLPYEVKIYRIDNKIYYSVDGGQTKTLLQSTDGFNQFIDTHAFFCAGDNGSGGAQRNLKGTISDYYIKLGDYPGTVSADETHTVTYPDGTIETYLHNEIVDLSSNESTKASENLGTVTFKYHNGDTDTTSTVVKNYLANGFMINGTHYDDEATLVVNEDKVITDSFDEEIVEAEFPEDPVKEHYTFTGWFDQETGGNEYTEYNGEEDIVLHAQYTQNTVTITTPDGPIEVPEGEDYELPTNDEDKDTENVGTVTFKLHNEQDDIVRYVTKTYTKNGWLINGTHYDDEAIINPTEDITLVPDYLETIIPVEFPSDPEKDNYEFIGWFDQETDGTKYTEYDSEEDITLHAQYEITLPTDMEIDSEDIEIVVGEAHQIVVTFTPEGTTDTITYTGFDSNKISVVDGLVTGLEAGETTITIGTENTDIEKTINVIVLDNKITSQILSVEDRNLGRIIIGENPETNINDFLDKIDNPREYLVVYDKDGNQIDKDEFDSTIVTTGMKVKLVIDGTEYDEVIAIIRGDIDQDGYVDISDSVTQLNHILYIELIDDYRLYAADVDIDEEAEEDEMIDISDNVKLDKFILGEITDLNE